MVPGTFSYISENLVVFVCKFSRISMKSQKTILRIVKSREIPKYPKASYAKYLEALFKHNVLEGTVN